MAYGHETDKGTRTGAEFAELEAARRATWTAYQSLPCAPGWQQASIDAAAESARAQYRLDKAKGYR